MKTPLALIASSVLLIGLTATAQSTPADATIVATHAAITRIGPVTELDRNAANITALRAWYGGEGTKAAVERALDWLARHQDPKSGGWKADGFAARCRGEPCAGSGLALNDTGLTGLGLLAFLGAGHTYREGRYKREVEEALKYLRRAQDPAGCFGGQSGHYMYSHAVATLAFTETWAVTRSPLLRRSVEKAIRFLLRAQNPDPAGDGKLGWRYTAQPGDNDTSVTGWAVMALHRAKASGLEVPPAALDGALRWLAQMTEPESGRTGYVKRGVSPTRSAGREQKWPARKSEAITALAMFTRMLCGEQPAASDAVRKGAGLCLQRLPAWNPDDGSIDHYYWFTGANALFQVGGDAWRRWNEAMKQAILPHQRKDGCAVGSWNPRGPWGEDGGRVYATALLALCLESYYRLPRLFPTVDEQIQKAEPILVCLTADEEPTTCTVDGKEIGTLPACAARIGSAVTAARKRKEHSVVALEVDFEAPFGHVISALDACIAERRARPKQAAEADAQSIRLLIPSDKPFRALQEVRLVRLKLPPPLPVDLPTCRTGTAPGKKSRYDTVIHVTHAERSGESHVFAGEERMGPSQLKAWLTSQLNRSIDPATRHTNGACWIYCDKAAQFGVVQETLAICADLDFPCIKIRLAVLEP